RGRENYLQTSGASCRENEKLFPRRPGLGPGPITTGFGCYAKSSNSVCHDKRHGVWVPAVRPKGAYHQWRRVPSRELSIDLVADERLVRVTVGSKPRDKGRLGRLSNPAGRNASEV